MFEHGYALLVGVDDNAAPELRLKAVRKDVDKIYELILHPQRCGYPKDQVCKLVGRRATRAGIMEGLDWLKENLQEDTSDNATAFLYYSGHGHRDDETGEAWLIPYDFRFPVELGGISAKSFAQAVSELQPRRLFAVLDCCHAEGMSVKGARPGQKIVSAALSPELIAPSAQADGDGRAVLSSSRGSQPSWVRADGRMSVFTYHLAEALTGHAGRLGGSTVLVTEAMDYVARQVPETVMRESNVRQDPAFQFTGSAFPIALVLGGKGVDAGNAAPDPLMEVPPPEFVSELEIDDLAGTAINMDVESRDRMRGRAITKVIDVSESGNLTGMKIRS